MNPTAVHRQLLCIALRWRRGAGDLGAIDKQYDIAVSTAGPALDYMVVADTACAQRCVELLRRRNLGVATFLLLDKQAHLAKAAAERVSPPEGTLREG